MNLFLRKYVLWSISQEHWWNKDQVVKWHQFDFLNFLGPVAVLVDLGSLFRMVWEGWVAVSPEFHQAVTPVPSTLLAIVIPGLFHLSYGRNVPLHEKRSSFLMACHGSSPVLSLGCQRYGHAFPRTQPPSHSSMKNVDIYYAGSLTLLYPGYLEEVSVLSFSLKVYLPMQSGL